MNPYFQSVVVLLCFSFMFNIILCFVIESKKKYNLFLLNKYQPFEKKKRLMSPNESKLFDILKNLEVVKNFDIFPQVPYSSLMNVNPNTSDLGMRFEIINSYRSDFVIADKTNSSIVLVIELNDQSHSYNYRKARDLFVYSALKTVGIPCLVLETKDLTKPNQIEQDIRLKLRF